MAVGVFGAKAGMGQLGVQILGIVSYGVVCAAASFILFGLIKGVIGLRVTEEEEVEGLDQGLRGSGSQGFASQISGLNQNEYLRRADIWPANPDGEILLGVKIEDSYALEN